MTGSLDRRQAICASLTCSFQGCTDLPEDTTKNPQPRHRAWLSGIRRNLQRPAMSLTSWLKLVVVAGLHAVLLSPTAVLSMRSLKVAISPDEGPISVPYDTSLPSGSDDIPEYLRPAVKVVPSIVPEQVSVTYWGEGQVLISWVTGLAQVGPKVAPPYHKSIQTKVQLCTKANCTMDGSQNSTMMSIDGSSITYVQDYSKLQSLSYASAIIHHTVVYGLTPGQQYFYRVGDPRYSAWSMEYNFTAVKANSLDSLPITIGLMADVGQTYNTSVTISHMLQDKLDLVFLIGDFTYADHYTASGIPGTGPSNTTYQPRWDTWARMWEPILSHVPVLHTNGNHEIEAQPDGMRQESYNARYPVPMMKAAGGHGQSIVSMTAANNNRTKGDHKNLYYSVDIPGAHVVWLTSYIAGDDFSHKSIQYKWLEADLKKVDRTKTPWLIVNWHAPWYHSYSAHYLENECMRQSYEPLLYSYGVDLVFNGHIHAYERTKPVKNYTVDECGAVHIVIGDGGNIEKLYQTFIDITVPAPAFCSNYTATSFPWYQPQRCFPPGTTNDNYCFKSQPDWSAYREPSFGHGRLTITNSTHASWSWNRNQDGASVVADMVMFERSGSCSSAA